MSFDAIAPHYRWLEWVTAGSLLQRCRLAHLHELEKARNILLLGEGRGRFLVELLRANAVARITSVEASARMIELTRASLRRHRLPEGRVRFVCADVLAGDARAAWSTDRFDAVASHFVLDCFPPEPLRQVVAAVGRCAAPGARWLISDFQVPTRGWRRVRARMILAGLYALFRVVTRLPARRLTAPDADLQDAGFRLKQRQCFNHGLLHSDMWLRSELSSDSTPSPRCEPGTTAAAGQAARGPQEGLPCRAQTRLSRNSTCNPPSSRLVALTVPPQDSTQVFTIVRPRPTPPVSRVLDSSTR